MDISRDKFDTEILRQTLWLVFWIGLCFLAAFIGAMFTDTGAGSWYDQLEKPSWNPPSSVFSPVWTTLYTLMGIAAWLVWRETDKFPHAKKALGLFIFQLALNTLWSVIFFGMQRLDFAFIEISVLWIAIAATMAVFSRYNYTATLLLAPYIAWVTFAGVLNFAIWWLN